MNTIQKICSYFLLLVVMASCKKQTNDNIDFVKTGKAVTDLAFTVALTPAGAATVTPTANGVSRFNVYFGQAPNAPVAVSPGKTGTYSYTVDGSYTIRVVAYNLSGDSLVLTRPVTVTTSQLLVDFDTPANTYPGGSFGGAAFARVANPSATGINTSANVGRIIKGTPGSPSETWAGVTINTSSPFGFSTRGIVRMKVYAPRVGAVYLFKLENPSTGTTVETQAVTTVANAWQELTFTMDPSVNGRTFGGMSVFFEFGLAGNGSANFTGYFDDIRIFP